MQYHTVFYFIDYGPSDTFILILIRIPPIMFWHWCKEFQVYYHYNMINFLTINTTEFTSYVKI